MKLKRWISWIIFLAVSVSAGALLIASDENTSAYVPAVAVAPEGLQQVRCDVASSATASLSCYRVSVEGAQLSVAVLYREDSAADSTPLVYLAGGPGVGVNTKEPMLTAWLQWYQRLKLQQPFVLIDPRGVEPSQPSWECGIYLQAAKEQWQRDLTYAQEASESNPLLSECFQRFSEAIQAFAPDAGVTQFSSRQYAADMASILGKLGYTRWDLLGVSYGTRLALTAALQQPQVRRVVLDSPYLLDRGESSDMPRLWAQAFGRFFGACDKGLWHCPSQARSEDLFWRVFENLNHRPLMVTVEDWAAGKQYTWLLNGERLAAVVYSAFYSSDLYRTIHPALAALEHGDSAPAQFLLELFYNQAFDTSFNNMVFWATECNDNEIERQDSYAATLAESGRFASLFIGDLQMNLCREDVFAPGQKPEMAKLDIPVLVVVGEWDPITPASDAVALMNWLPNGLYLPLTDRSHAEFVMSDCGAAVIPWFFKHPKR